MDRYKKVKTIGKGGFAKVYLVKDQHNRGSTACMKVIEIGGMSREEQAAAKIEVQILASLNHPNIIGYYDSFLHNNRINIVMEHAPNGDLHGKIQAQGAHTFKEDRITSWLAQILAAIRHIHGQKMIHRDIKPQNVFLTANDEAKIGDFGITKVMAHQSMARTQIGTPFYISPEICQSKPYDAKSDIWALGCLAHELATLRPPFMADDLKAMMKRICYAKAPPIASFYSQELRESIIEMMHKDQRKRPSARRLMDLPIYAAHAPTGPPPPSQASSNSSQSSAPSVASSRRSNQQSGGQQQPVAAAAHGQPAAAVDLKDTAARKLQKFWLNTKKQPRFRDNPRWRDEAAPKPQAADVMLGAAAERAAKPARRGSSFPRDARDDEVQFEGPQRNPAERGSYPPSVRSQGRRHSFDGVDPKHDDAQLAQLAWQRQRRNAKPKSLPNSGDQLPDVHESRPPPLGLDAACPGAYPGANPSYGGRSRRRPLQRREEDPRYVLPHVDDPPNPRGKRDFHVRQRRGSI